MEPRVAFGEIIQFRLVSRLQIEPMIGNRRRFTYRKKATIPSIMNMNGEGVRSRITVPGTPQFDRYLQVNSQRLASGQMQDGLCNDHRPGVSRSIPGKAA